ncbi:hypothetical protein [Rhizobium sp. NFR07]|uniref:hypothetical protein n=1 Tax=Rhizobium sp. NFR07 TaxID=1566262 RepID=UPI0011602BB2|nr:hypothetical protein [Rhizobium sp. NFR07]
MASYRFPSAKETRICKKARGKTLRRMRSKDEPRREHVFFMKEEVRHIRQQDFFAKLSQKYKKDDDKAQAVS